MSKLNYFEELKRSMDYLAAHPDTLFLGQAVEYAGTAMTNTLKDVPAFKKLEMPVNEDMQMGITNGLALDGKIPVSIFPRWNFLILATNQLVNHLDKMIEYSGFKTKVIIRTSIGSKNPLNPQIQHVGDYSFEYSTMVNNIDIVRLDTPEDIFPSYEMALNRTDGKSTLLVEWGDAYNPEWKIEDEYETKK